MTTETTITKSEPTPRPFVVTTERGAFFGYGDGRVAEDGSITLQLCRMCVYWPTATHGVVGLAANGPQEGARVSPAAPAVHIRNVTAVMDCTAAAAAAWEKEPWQ